MRGGHVWQTPGFEDTLFVVRCRFGGRGGSGGRGRGQDLLSRCRLSMGSGKGIRRAAFPASGARALPRCPVPAGGQFQGIGDGGGLRAAQGPGPAVLHAGAARRAPRGGRHVLAGRPAAGAVQNTRGGREPLDERPPDIQQGPEGGKPQQDPGCLAGRSAGASPGPRRLRVLAAAGGCQRPLPKSRGEESRPLRRAEPTAADAADRQPQAPRVYVSRRGGAVFCQRGPPVQSGGGCPPPRRHAVRANARALRGGLVPERQPGEDCDWRATPQSRARDARDRRVFDERAPGMLRIARGHAIGPAP
mmetsp:Transcript_112391/g.358876  ORF Transcript_112391/g.358876 Transcript_112391/m.358876 type:complete len:304 (-) Transcript_112391:1604-2515(-)